MDSLRRTPRTAFTLVELLVVLAVIAIFVGAFATALRPGNPTVAVQGAQANFASLLTQARGVAVLKGADTRLIVNANPDNPDRFLRFAGIVFDANNDPDNPDWRAATDGVSLPNGVFVIPPSAGDGVTLDDWDSNVVSRFSSTSTDSFEYISNASEPYYYVSFDRRGLVPQDAGPPILAVGTAQPSSDGTGLNFDNPNSARGLIVRLYGSFVLLNEAAAFPNP